MSAHSPGPWKIDCDGISDAQGFLVGDMCGAQSCQDTRDADARLAAAAPELLAALEGLLERAPPVINFYVVRVGVVRVLEQLMYGGRDSGHLLASQHVDGSSRKAYLCHACLLPYREAQ